MQLIGERAERFRHVLVRAEQRRTRREEALRRLVQARPEEPRGILDALQRKGQQQALLAWQAAKEAAAQLVEQAKRLAARLLEAARPAHLAAWARDYLQREPKHAAAVSPAERSNPPEPPKQPQQAKARERQDFSRFSIEDQYRIYDSILDKLVVHGKKKVERVAGKVAQRLERRQTLAMRAEASVPEKPQGLLAAFRQREYDQAVKAYWQRQRQARSLVDEAAKLKKDVLEATHRTENWALRKLRSLEPEFVDRVHRHVAAHNQLRQLEDLKRQRELQRQRGYEGPQKSR